MTRNGGEALQRFRDRYFQDEFLWGEMGDVLSFGATLSQLYILYIRPLLCMTRHILVTDEKTVEAKKSTSLQPLYQILQPRLESRQEVYSLYTHFTRLPAWKSVQATHLPMGQMQKSKNLGCHINRCYDTG